MEEAQASRKRKLEELKARRQEINLANAALKNQEGLLPAGGRSLPGADEVLDGKDAGGQKIDKIPSIKAAPPLVLGWGTGDHIWSSRGKRANTCSSPRSHEQPQQPQQPQQQQKQHQGPNKSIYAPSPHSVVTATPGHGMNGLVTHAPNGIMFPPSTIPMMTMPQVLNSTWQGVPPPPPPGMMIAPILQQTPFPPGVGHLPPGVHPGGHLAPPPPAMAYVTPAPGLPPVMLGVHTASPMGPPPMLTPAGIAGGWGHGGMSPRGYVAPGSHPGVPLRSLAPGSLGNIGVGAGGMGIRAATWKSPFNSAPPPTRSAVAGQGRGDDTLREGARHSLKEGPGSKEAGKRRDGGGDDGGSYSAGGEGEKDYYKPSFVEDPWKNLLVQGPQRGAGKSSS